MTCCEKCNEHNACWVVGICPDPQCSAHVSNPFFDHVTTVSTAVLTREVFEEGMEAIKAADARMLREQFERAQEVRKRREREGEPGPLQARVDRMYIDGGPIIMGPRQAAAMNEALRRERDG